MSSHATGNLFTKAVPENLAITLEAARRGDRQAFSLLAEPHRLELLTHCYRMLGSLEDAEDQVQETFLRAWKRIDTYEGRASFRAWLYKIATNACLDALKDLPRRSLPPDLTMSVDLSAPLPPPRDPSLWIQPFPEDLLAPTNSSPEAHYDAYEGISLAFLVALHVLPSRQRGVLILKDVLDWSIAEIAGAMDTSQSSVTSLLHRARVTMHKYNVTRRQHGYRKNISDQQTRQLLDRYMHAWESADIDGIVSLLTEDATFPMPPFPIWIQGKSLIRAFISLLTISGEAQNRWKLIPIRANGQPGYAIYQADEPDRRYAPFALQLLTIENNLVTAITTFGFPSLFRFFNLPASLPF